MSNYIFKRFLAGLLTTLMLATVTFFLMHAIPGSPFSPEEDKKVPAKIIEAINEKYGLNDPVPIQYLNYMKNVLKGDLGISFIQQNVSVNEIIKRGFPVSAKVGFIAVIVSLIIGVTLGIISAVKRGSWMDYFSMVFATIGISVPSFILAVLMMYLFCQVFKILPSYGISTWRHYILPVTGLALAPIAYIARLTRSSMLEVMRQDYIRTARSKGVSEFFVIMKHALINAIIPVVTYLGPLIAGLLTGSFIIERLFVIPGIGREYVTSIGDRDYAVILGITVFFGILVIVANILVDILYVVIDPRVKIDE